MLKGNQHKIDMNKNGKIDAEDFKKLRKEEQELLEYDSKEGVYRHKGTYGYAGKGSEFGQTDYEKANDDEQKETKAAKRKYGARQNRRTDTKLYKESFSGMLKAYNEQGYKGLMESMQVIEEDVEQLDELSAGTMKSYIKGAKADKSAQQDQKSSAIAADDHKTASDSAQVIAKRNAGIKTAKAKLNAEEVELAERTLSEPEMKKREEVVKSMKKGIEGFKDRYGDRAKEVMYATATKIAKKG
jgi:hypothetical protein